LREGGGGERKGGGGEGITPMLKGIGLLSYLSKERRGGLMVSALVSGSSGPGSSPGWGHCVVFLGKTLNSHSASLHPGV